MTIRTSDINSTMDRLIDLLVDYEPDTKIGVTKTWANERKIVLTREDKSKTYEVELAVGRADPTFAAARIVLDWLVPPKKVEPHDHDWTEWSYAFSPTGRRTCKNCGKIDID